MSEPTPSQAEGERQEDAATDEETEHAGHPDVSQTTPSQAEGDRTDEEEAQDDT